MAMLQIRVDDKLKADADALFADIGIDTPTAIRAFLKQSLKHNGLPFALVRETPNAETLAAIEDVRLGQNLLGPFSSVDALMEALNAED